MGKPLRVLVVEDSEDDAALLAQELRRGGYNPTFERVDTAAAMVAALREREWDVVIADYVLPRFSGIAALNMLRKCGLDLPFIIVSGRIGEETAVEAMRAGAHDYIMKDNLGRLAPAIERELRESVVRRERRRAEEQSRRQLERVQALRDIDRAINASLDLHLTLDVLLEKVIAQLQVDAAGVLLLNRSTQTLEYAAGRGFCSDAVTRTRVRLGEGFAGRAALERRVLNCPNLRAAAEMFVHAELVEREGFTAYHVAPLVAKGEVKGVLELFHRSPLDPSPDWLDFVQVLAELAAIAIDNAAMFEDLQRSHAELSLAYDSTLDGWSRALELRDRETEGHTRRVTDMTLRLARALGMGEDELVHVRRGALLHDIGKMAVPDNILLKPAPLTEEEWAIMRRHPVHAYEMLSPITYLRPALDIPYCHHEKWDGTGYPRGLRGEDIPLAARIFAVVDVWDALRSDRPYRSAWPEARVREHIRSLAGTHFEPRVVEVFFTELKRGLAEPAQPGGEPQASDSDG